MNLSIPMEAKEMFAQFICDNCIIDMESKNPHHRCRSDADSCIEGIECPDYIEYCTCKCNE